MVVALTVLAMREEALRGTDGSNPSPSSKESVANLTPDKATEASCA
jgi:hypothetical protein